MNNIWILTIVDVCLQEPSNVKADAFIDEVKAIEAFNVEHNEWKEHYESEYDDFENWLYENIDNKTYKYLHYIYHDGMEKIFILQRKEVL